MEVCRQLRTFSDAYVVMLTARDTEVDTIVGLSVAPMTMRDQTLQPPGIGCPHPGDASPPSLGGRAGDPAHGDTLSPRKAECSAPCR